MSTTYNDPVSPRPGSYELEHTMAAPPLLQRVSWQAVFAGVILAVTVQLLLSMLGLGVGLGMVNTNAGNTPNASSFGIGTGIWWLVSNLVALAIGGYVAAWMAGITLKFDGMLHGLVTWGIATLFTFYLLSTAVGGLIGGAYSVVGSTLSAAGSTVKTAAAPVAQAAGLSPDMMQQQVQGYLQPTDPDPATMSPQDAQKAIASELPTYVGGGSGAPAARERIITIMAAQMHVSHDDAAKRFDDLQAKATQTKNQAIQTAKNAADQSAQAGSTAAYLAFGVLLLGGIVAAIAGSLATQRRMLSAGRRLNT
ncbi:MAG: hypothetical protein ACRYG8_50550 [Janthinobacterium lividum]